MPEPSPTVSPSSSVESLFDNVNPQGHVIGTPRLKNTVRHNLAYRHVENLIRVFTYVVRVEEINFK